jgi:hypothetical protein
LSLKENIDLVKQELNSEEKIFESTVKAEYFLKKYKNKLIGAGVVVALLVGGSVAYKAYEVKRVNDANMVFLELLQDENSDKKDELKSLAPSLYEAYQLSRAVANGDQNELDALKSSKNRVIADLATYQKATLSKDVKLLDNYTYEQNAIYKDFAIIESAFLLIKESKIKEAKEKLRSISIESPMYKISRLLLHYKV